MVLKVLISKAEGVFPKKAVEYWGIVVAGLDYNTILVRDEDGGFHTESTHAIKSSRWTPGKAEIVSIPNPEFRNAG